MKKEGKPNDAKGLIGNLPETAMLAGGALTSFYSKKPIKDYDLYFRNRQDFEDAIHQMYEMNYWCVSVTPRAVTFVMGADVSKRDVVQLMHFDWFESPSAIFNSFDFTVCMCAVDVKSGAVTSHERFFSDLCRRELVFNSETEFPIASALRVVKYQERGYTIDKAEMLKVALACSFKKVKDWQELQLQIGGHYGDMVMLDTSEEFNLHAAIEAIEKQPNLDITSQLHMPPGTPEELFEVLWPTKEKEEKN